MSQPVIAVVLLALLLPCVPVCGYLILLTLAAPFGVRASPKHRIPAIRFAVLVPAHNEAAVLGRLLSSIALLDYPTDLTQTVVVADNCDDNTAAIAVQAGAVVLERSDPEHPGKGAALGWMLDQLRQRGFNCDAYVLVDADCMLSANFLAIMNHTILDGADVVQGYYGVLSVNGTWLEWLREACLALVHFLRPAAKTALGVSCGLKGTGMAFRRELLDRFGWPSRGLAEDVEFHLMLVEAGFRVQFAPRAVVRGEMPGSLHAARSQNRRWEAGRLATLRKTVWPLLGRGLRQRSLAQIDAAFEQLVPPLSIAVLFLLLVTSVALPAHLPLIYVPAVIMLGVVLLYVLAGLALARVPARAYLALATAPIYIGWKAVLYGRLLVRGHEPDWIRTSRTELSSDSTAQ